MENENHIFGTEREELVFLREESRTHKQIFEIILGLSTFIIFAGVLYWISSLAMVGAKYAYLDFRSMQLAQVTIFGFSILILIFYWMFQTSAYSTLYEDAGIWIVEFIKKFQAASEAWVKMREKLEEN